MEGTEMRFPGCLGQEILQGYPRQGRLKVLQGSSRPAPAGLHAPPACRPGGSSEAQTSHGGPKLHSAWDGLSCSSEGSTKGPRAGGEGTYADPLHLGEVTGLGGPSSRCLTAPPSACTCRLRSMQEGQCVRSSRNQTQPWHSSTMAWELKPEPNQGSQQVVHDPSEAHQGNRGSLMPSVPC